MSGIKITHRNFWNSFFRFSFLKTGFLIFENLRLGKRVFVKQKIFVQFAIPKLDFSKNVNAEKWFPFSSALFPLLFLLEIDLPDLDLLILKSRNDGTVIWKLDFKKLDLDGWMCVKPKCWMRNLEIRFLKIDGTEIMVPVFTCIFFVGFFSASFSSIYYFKNSEESWRRNA